MARGFMIRLPVCVALCWPALVGVPAAGLAQAPAVQAPPATVPNPQLAAAQAVFEALPEAERKAIQTDLIWAGSFTGAASGSYGPLTFRAINALKAGRGTPDGVITPGERRILADAARQARDAVGFRMLVDERTGVAIGVPTRLLPKREATPSGGSRWQSEDGKVTLDTATTPQGETLDVLFEKATGAVVPGRKITYKLLRPDFFVITGETATGKFYRRLAAGPAGLRGFSIGYDKALAGSVDRLVIAIANSFEPFPGARPPAIAAPAIAGVTAPIAAMIAPARATERFGVGLAVAERLVLTAMAAIEPCKALRVSGRAARLRGKDEGSGLALLEVDGAALPVAPGLRPEPLVVQDYVVMIAYGDAGGQRAAMAVPGQVSRLATATAVSAPLQPGQAGAVVFDRQGRLAGVVTANPSDRFMVAGVLPQRSHAMADGATVQAMLGKAGVTVPAGMAAGDLSTGAVVEKAGRSVLSVSCGI